LRQQLTKVGYKIKIMKKLFMTAMMIAMSMGMNAQTVQKQVVEEGGTGPFKSEVVGDADLHAEW
jgi:hypothetical protein